MVGRGLKQRLEALEGNGAEHPGFAVIDVHAGETIDTAKARWETSNGPIGGRIPVVYDFGGLHNAAT